MHESAGLRRRPVCSSIKNNDEKYGRSGMTVPGASASATNEQSHAQQLESDNSRPTLRRVDSLAIFGCKPETIIVLPGESMTFTFKQLIWRTLM